mmetsp:Transcript_25596/g.52490  ORF Transcript_25596/g.52490 Transcript_25596/m.52490 type:complete len:228 (+) Transcript_25596:680-1363(+)
MNESYVRKNLFDDTFANEVIDIEINELSKHRCDPDAGNDNIDRNEIFSSRCLRCDVTKPNCRHSDCHKIQRIDPSHRLANVTRRKDRFAQSWNFEYCSSNEYGYIYVETQIEQATRDGAEKTNGFLFPNDVAFFLYIELVKQGSSLLWGDAQHGCHLDNLLACNTAIIVDIEKSGLLKNQFHESFVLFLWIKHFERCKNGVFFSFARGLRKFVCLVGRDGNADYDEA